MMGGACSTHRVDEKCIQKFWLKSLKGKDHSEDLVTDGRIILKWISRKYGFDNDVCVCFSEVHSLLKSNL
jgi:hypothetical protein